MKKFKQFLKEEVSTADITSTKPESMTGESPSQQYNREQPPIYPHYDDPQPDMPDIWDYDQDGDGKISPEEEQQWYDAMKSWSEDWEKSQWSKDNPNPASEPDFNPLKPKDWLRYMHHQIKERGTYLEPGETPDTTIIPNAPKGFNPELDKEIYQEFIQWFMQRYGRNPSERETVDQIANWVYHYWRGYDPGFQTPIFDENPKTADGKKQ